MRYAPRRLRRRTVLAPGSAVPSAPTEPLFSGRRGPLLLGSVRASRRLLLLLLWTLVAMPIQAVCLLLPGSAKVWFARRYWATFCRLLGMRVRVLGAPAAGPRPVVFVSNHSSWVDVPVLGGQLNACFVSKGEVGTWPLVGAIARLGRTVFISRQRGATARERDFRRARRAAGDNLILFPEGTTSDGSRVMPFRSAFFAVAEGQDPPLLQPVSVVYDRLSGLPTGRATRPVFAYYGDMDLASHYWRLGRHRGLRVTVLFHAPLDPSAFANRKELAQAVWRIIAEGAATLRQNRPVAAADRRAGETPAQAAYA
ncbi:MAG: lysophospholipid acyltransferase family protein [Acetobacteraceae bacterium]